MQYKPHFQEEKMKNCGKGRKDGFIINYCAINQYNY
jgi:hypothetical protein